ncbi:MAG: hypothetical protein EOR57_31530 [Mesorhizobium sp.]|uniref:hypothetical protein n=1 Tax=Mesorhizobium sp. TaxID=1871066 RepID=UPI000FE9DB7E|nr:hypothetical protein [Mesorhizobium sp.]RWL14879.1 MAG: hypothetical protein EOR57_31530 [Mesorhizobium sp.]
MEAHAPAPYDKSILMAIRACFAGNANEGQQKAAMEWIVLEASRTRHLSFAGEATHATAFADGRRFVGMQVAGMLDAKALDHTTEAKALKRAPRQIRGKRQEAKND